MQEFPYLFAFLGGVLSFLSPCVLPLIPAYVSFITGMSLADLSQANGAPTARVTGGALFQSVLFVSGFSAVFILMGASATALGGLIAEHQKILRLVGGIVIGLFGLHLMGLIRFRFLQYESRLHLEKKPAHVCGAVLVGAAFALGWTPCIGPILSGILTYASVQKTVAKGVLLLALYSLGMAIPFLLSSVAINVFLRFFSRIRRYMGVITFASGLILVIAGVLIATGNFQSWM